MRYLLLIHTDTSQFAKLSPAEQAQGMAAYGKFTADLQAAGVFLGAERLRPAASTIRIRDGQTLTTDGPSRKPGSTLAASFLFRW